MSKKEKNYDVDIDSLEESISKSSRDKRKLLDELKNIENDDSLSSSPSLSASSFLPSSLLKNDNGESVLDVEERETNDDYNKSTESWFNSLEDFTSLTFYKSKHYKGIDYNPFEERKKKKKKKDEKKGEIDYKKEFAPEMALYKNLLVEQNRFTDSLQKEYDSIKSVKSSSRGVTKQLSDLIENITEARSLSMQLVDKHVNAKKLIAELNLKQKKELGGFDEEGADMNAYASTLLKQMFQDRSQFFQNSDITVSDYNEQDEELLDLLEDGLNVEGADSNSSTNEEADKMLHYETLGVKVYIQITDDDIENYEFIAYDRDGNLIEDYPMPLRTEISVNPSTNVATNKYGEKYDIIWVNSEAVI